MTVKVEKASKKEFGKKIRIFENPDETQDWQEFILDASMKNRAIEQCKQFQTFLKDDNGAYYEFQMVARALYLCLCDDKKNPIWDDKLNRKGTTKYVRLKCNT